MTFLEALNVLIPNSKPKTGSLPFKPIQKVNPHRSKRVETKGYETCIVGFGGEGGIGTWRHVWMPPKIHCLGRTFHGPQRANLSTDNF